MTAGDAPAQKGTLADQIIAACEKQWDAHKDDCSGFLKAVAADLGLVLNGQANAIIDTISGTWKSAGDGAAAATFAADGKFVIGGLKDEPNGHVVVVVKGPLNRGKYPTAYWGKLHGVGKKKTTINWSWDATDRDKVQYWYCAVAGEQNPGPVAGRAINWSLRDLEQAVGKWFGR